jgi:hypothetical protein
MFGVHPSLPQGKKELWWCSGYHIQKVSGTWHTLQIARDIKKVVGSNSTYGIFLLMGDEDAIHETGCFPIIVVTLIGSVVSILERPDQRISQVHEDLALSEYHMYDLMYTKSI